MPFEIPEEWCWCRLDCVGEIVTGSTPSKDNVDYYGGSVPFYKPTDLEQGINTIEASDSLTELGFSVSRQLPSQSILVTCIGATIGKTGLIQKRGTCNQQINAIISNDMVLPEYLYYTCISGYMQNEIIGRASATTLPILNKNKFSEIPIPVPPIQEQHRIISKIKTFFSFVIELENSDKELIGSISTAKSKILDLAIHGKLVPQDESDEPASELLKRINPKAIASCDNPHYGILPENWCWVKLGQLFNIVSAKRVTKDQWKSVGVPFYRTREIVQLSQNGHVDNDLFIDIEHYESLKNKYGIPQPGDIMLTAVGTIGKTYVVSQDDKFYYKDASVLCMRNVHNINSQYIELAFCSSLVQKQLYEKSKGTTVDTITIEKANNYIFPIPPIEEQNRIVAKVNELFSQLDMIKKSLQA